MGTGGHGRLFAEALVIGTSDGTGAAGGDGIGLLVDDVDEALAELRAAGCPRMTTCPSRCWCRAARRSDELVARELGSCVAQPSLDLGIQGLRIRLRRPPLSEIRAGGTAASIAAVRFAPTPSTGAPPVPNIEWRSAVEMTPGWTLTTVGSIRSASQDEYVTTASLDSA